MARLDEKNVALRDGAVVTLRSPEEDDAERLIAYLDRVRRETEFIMFDPADELPTLDTEREWIRKSVENPLALKILVEADGQVVGLCDVTGGVGIRRMRHRAEIGISILAAWCDRGLGTLLMGELIGWARRQPEITLLRLAVFSHNRRALAVYRKVGFVEEGVRRCAARYTDGRYVDEVVMSMWIGDGARGSAAPAVAGVAVVD